MEKKTIFTKTAKGLRESSGKTSLLSRDMRNLLKDIDGKSSVRDLLKKLDDVSEADLKEALTILAREDFIRELVQETPEVVTPPPRISPQTQPPAGGGGEELDFTSLPPLTSRPDEAAAERARAEEALRQAQAARAKQEAEARVKAEAEARVKAEAEARAKKEAENRARKEAEERARLEAEARAKQEAKAKAEADKRAQEAPRAREAAEEKARREAEERARQEAEVKAAAEVRARKEAEDRARREAEEKAKREAEEERARKEAEEKARRETEEKAKREAEEREKKQAEEQARREAEERARQEAKAEAEARTRREAEERVRCEAEEKARREAEEERARKEAEEDARRVAEERAEREAEEQARQQAEEQARRQAEERARRDEEEARVRRELAEAKLAAKAAKSDGGKSYGWGRLLAAALVALPVLGLALIHVMSFDGKIPQLEKAASMQLLQPVRIATLHASLFPRPHWRLGGVVVGEGGQIKAPQIRLAAGLGSVFGGDMTFESLEVESPVFNEEGLAWLLFGKPQGQGAKPGWVNVVNAKLDSPSISLPAFAVKAEAGGDGVWRKMTIESADKALTLDLTSQGETVQFEASASSFAVPFGSSLVLPDFSATGTATRGGVTVTEFKSRFHGGVLTGSAKLQWSRQWSLDGDLGARQIDTALLLPGLLEGDKLEGKASYAMRAGEAMKLFNAPRLEGAFVIRKGVLLGVDLGRLLQSGETSGKTEFSELTGSFVHERGTTQLQQLRLSAGILSANGSVEVDTDKNIRGRLAIDLRMAAEQRRASLAVSGTTKAVAWRR